MNRFLLLLIFSTPIFSQKISDSIVSTKLEETREITIGLPSSYETDKTKIYPLLILLDGGYLFDPFSGALSYGMYWDDMPETIIVGINQNKIKQRIEDCDYEDVNYLPTQKASLFFEFIGAELIPYIEKKYRVAPFRIIAGHDKTAAFMNFYLYKNYSIFNAYISLSPDLVPEMEERIPERLSSLKQSLLYYQSTGENEIKSVLDPITRLDINIKNARIENLKYTYDTFKGATHYTSVLHSIPNALYSIFEEYKPITLSEYSDKIEPLKEGQVKYLTNKYESISKKFGLTAPIRLSDFKAIETAILNTGNFEELGELSDLAKKTYPETMLAEYELGLMFEKLDNPKRAAKSYKSAAQFLAIGELTKDLMFEKLDEMQSLIQKENVKK